MATLFARVAQGFRRFPGLGRRSAERLTFHLLEMKTEEVEAFAEALVQYRRAMKPCRQCGLHSESDPCRICQDGARQADLFCVVKDSADALAVERSGGFSGRYHVLGGLLSPLRGRTEADLRVAELVKRCGPSSEVLFALDRTVEADVTKRLVQKRLAERGGIRFTELATGIPTGAGLSTVDAETIKGALANRRGA